MDEFQQIAERMRKNLKAKKSDAGFKCEKCSDTGLIRAETGLYDTFVECDCVIRARNERNIERANFSELFKNKDFSNYKATDEKSLALKNKCISFLQQDDLKAVALLGNVGCGKTHLAVSIIKELAKKGMPVSPVGYTELTRKLSSNANDEVAYFNLLGKYTSTPVLLLDDMWKGKITEANIKQMYDLINERYVNGKITIITSEKTITEMMQIDEAIASRIVEMAGGKFLLNITKMSNYRIKDFN